jgi:hypothetical protein
METFFVTYNTGEYDSYHDHVYAIDAVSKEALYEEISNAFDNFSEYMKKYHKDHKELDDLYRPKSANAGEKQFKEYHIKLNEFYENNPYISNFSVFGHKIAVFDETMTCEKQEAFERSGFEIYTIEEYIERVRPEKESV